MLTQTPSKFSRLAIALLVLASTLLLALGGYASSDEQLTSEQVFRQRCASCHGAKGEGAKSYNKPLVGTRSVNELSAFIAKFMPPAPARKLPAEDAKRVAAYIFDAFYSPLAQERNRPARIELSRLTVRQYRNAVADLIGSFRPQVKTDESRGLKGEYFKTGQLRRVGPKILERIDPEIHFNFGDKGPLPEQDDPYQFAMRWQGSVLAPDTGEYEIIVKTEHAARLWINDLNKPLIDGYVKSGNDNEYHASIYMLGGRAYPLKMEFSKGVVGVDNLAVVKKKPPVNAMVSLEWRPPKRALEVIPQRCLLPVAVSEVFSPIAPFPPDDRSIGYERGTSVSKAWDDASTEAAIETAGYVAIHLRELSGAGDSDSDRETKVKNFCRQFIERAFRRPLTDSLAQLYVDRQFRSAANPETAVKKIVLLALMSPRFLYVGLSGPGADSYAVASRISFGLWDSIPDQELLKAAASGQLATKEQVVGQAERMAADPRAWFKLRQFFLQWLKIDSYPDLAKDPKQFPGFDLGTASDLRTSLELFLEQTAWSGKADFRELLQSDKLLLNGRLAKFYGVGMPQDAAFQPVSLGAEERAGVLTHPYLMSCFAYRDSSSPIHRGVLLARNLLGRALRPPPEAIVPAPASLHPNMTTRQRVAMQTQSPACMTCHGMINPLGFTLERFDAIGRFHKEENGKPIDASGSYQTSDGKVVKFEGVRDLAKFMAGSEDAHTAFVEKLFHHVVKQPVRAYGPNTLSNLVKYFETNEFNIKKLMVEMVAETALKR